VLFLGRKIAREQAFRLLFAVDVGENTIEEASELVMDSLNDDQKNFALREVKGVLNNMSSIDEVINKYSEDWPVSRMAAADRNILRLAVFEILHCDDIPVSVAINEAIELAKKYGDEKSYKFINGLLGSIARDHLTR